MKIKEKKNICKESKETGKIIGKKNMERIKEINERESA